MAWKIFTEGSKLNWAVGVAGLVSIIFWGFKIQTIQGLKVDIAALETKLRNGQGVWKRYPPLSPGERLKLQEAQEKLFSMLPSDKDLPPLLQELSRLARDHNLTDVSFRLGEGPVAQQPTAGAPAVVAPQPSPAASPKSTEVSGPIDSFPLKVSFGGDYRDIAYFLESFHETRRVISIESLQVQRSVPLIQGDVLLRAYYYKGNMSAGTK